MSARDGVCCDGHVHPRRRAGAVAAAWVGLALIDLLMKVGGFFALYRLVRRWPVRPGRGCREDAASLCATVDRAAMYYFKSARCLQRSAVTAILLRRRGFPAEMVIGARPRPFGAHAWVEIDGRIVNDEAWLPQAYTVLDRC